jgi:hypothetical protein
MPSKIGGHGGHGGPFGHGRFDPTISFTFSADSSDVTAMTVGAGTRTRSIDISDDTFKTTVGTNDKGVTAVLSVERTQTETSKSEVEIYSDKDGDGSYSKVFDIHVLTATTGTVETHAYTYAADGSVATDTETRGTHTHAEKMGDNVSYQKLTLEGETYVVRTVTLGNDDVRFEITRDDNADGKWTTLARGEVDASVAATYVDATTGDLKLAGIIDFLDPAADIVG